MLPFDVQRQEAGGEAFTIQLQELLGDQTLDPTGIKTIRSKADEGNEEKAYNLSGQRVSETYKGIVIKNGIKVVK